MKSLLIFIICFSIISCNQKNGKIEKLSKLDSVFQSQNFDTTAIYSEPCCLQYKGRPLLTIGQSVKLLDTSFSFRTDPNGSYSTYSNIITDYLSTDDYYSAEFSTSSLSGIIFISADKKGRIFDCHLIGL